MTPDAPGGHRSAARAAYPRGGVQRWHADVLERAVDVALARMPMPLRMLDVGCGEGELLGELVVRVPYADAYVGVDPLAEPLRAARRRCDLRVSFVRAAAGSLPFPDASFDLVLSSFSFTLWPDQRAGLSELARVLTPAGKVVLVDATRGRSGRSGSVHGRKDVSALFAAGGLDVDQVETLGRTPLGQPRARAFIASL